MFRDVKEEYFESIQKPYHPITKGGTQMFTNAGIESYMLQGSHLCPPVSARKSTIQCTLCPATDS
jgi:hypothetical protein